MPPKTLETVFVAPWIPLPILLMIFFCSLNGIVEEFRLHKLDALNNKARSCSNTCPRNTSNGGSNSSSFQRTYTGYCRKRSFPNSLTDITYFAISIQQAEKITGRKDHGRQLKKSDRGLTPITLPRKALAPALQGLAKFPIRLKPLKTFSPNFRCNKMKAEHNSRRTPSQEMQSRARGYYMHSDSLLIK